MSLAEPTAGAGFAGAEVVEGRPACGAGSIAEGVEVGVDDGLPRSAMTIGVEEGSVAIIGAGNGLGMDNWVGQEQRGNYKHPEGDHESPPFLNVTS